MVGTILALAIATFVTVSVFIVIPVGLAMGTKEQREYREWRKANGYEV